MVYLQQFQHFHWAFWASIGFMIGLGTLLIGMRMWDACKGNPSGTMYQTAFQQGLRKRLNRMAEVYISSDDPTGRRSTGRVIDCCVASISLRSIYAFTAGTILNVRPVDMPAAFGLAKVEVKEAKQEGSKWTLACRFIHTPPWVTRYCDDVPAAAGQEGAKLGA